MALGHINLPVTFSDSLAVRTETITFDVVQMPYQFNAILGRATLNSFSAVAHHNYMCIKMPALEGVITVRGDQDLARQIELGTDAPNRRVHTVAANPEARTTTASGKWAPKAKPEGQLRRLPLRDDCPEKTVALGAELPPSEADAILGVLRANADAFAWGPEDIPGVARETIEHRLPLRSEAPPKKQRL